MKDTEAGAGSAANLIMSMFHTKLKIIKYDSNAVYIESKRMISI